MVARGEDLDLCGCVLGRCRGYLHAADLVRGLDRGDEPQAVVALPDDVHGVVVELGRQVLHAARAAVVDEQPLLVRLVARAAHRAEGDLRVVGRPDGILVVAGHVAGGGRLTRRPACRLADVLRPARGQVVDEDVRVGRYGVGRARQRLAGIGQLRAGVVPGDLGHVEVGGQRGVPCRIGHDVAARGDEPLAQFADEDVAVGPLVPVVPVADHQVFVDAGLRLVHVLVDVRRADGDTGRLHALHPPDVFAVGAYAEALDVGDALAAALACHERGVAAVGIHHPDLRRAAAVREEVNAAAVRRPGGRRVVRREVGELVHGARGHLLHVDGRHAAVLGHVVVRHGVEQAAAVGRERRRARTAHLPHHFGRQTSGGDLLGRQGVVDRKGLGPLVAAPESHSCNSHHQEDFFHFR